MNQGTPDNNENNVVYVGDFLLRRLNKLKAKRDTLIAHAMSISKKTDPRQDAFAKVIMAKADKIDPQIEATEKHLSFIMRASATTHFPKHPDAPAPQVPAMRAPPVVKLSYTPHQPII